jgi:hypothetical protein
MPRLVILIFCGLLATGCRGGKDGESSASSTDAGTAGPPLEAMVANATAVEAAKLQQWPDARRHADKAITAAPEWSEAYFVRSGILIALAGPTTALDKLKAFESELMTRGHLDVDAVTLLTSTEWEGKGSTHGVVGSAVRVAFSPRGKVTLRFEDRSEYVAFTIKDGGAWATLSTGSRVTVTPVDGMLELKEQEPDHPPAIWKLWPVSPDKVPSTAPSGDALRNAAVLLASAARDLETYLRLRPDAPDKATVLQAIAQLSIRAEIATRLADKLSPGEPGAARPKEEPAARPL